MIGTQILNYEIKSVLGEGGMGTVYLAEHTKLGRKVAIKVLLPHLMRNELVKSRFINEAKLMSTLHHPNIVTLYDYHEDEHGLSLIMELAEGNPLDQYIQEVTGPIQEKDAVILMTQALNGFEYAHKQGLVHRDIKPANLIVTQSKQIKILDFGIAKLVGELGNKLTKTGSHIGTVYYMSPEQVRGHEIDVRSDIYALGVTFYQMLTGSCPYEGMTSEFDVFNKIVGEDLPDPKSIYPGILDHMCRVIQKATSKNPDERFQSCEEFKEALQNDDFKVNEPEEKQDLLPVSVDPTTEVNNQLASEHRDEKSREKKKKRVIFFSLVGFAFLPILVIIFLSLFSKPESNDQLGSNTAIADGNNVLNNKEQEDNTDKINEEQKRLLEENEKLEKEIENQRLKEEQLEIERRNEEARQNEEARLKEEARKREEARQREEIRLREQQQRQEEQNRQRERDRQKELDSKYKNVVFKNNSSYSKIWVALLYWDGSTWVTEGWWGVASGSTITLPLPDYYNTGYFYYHAFSGSTTWGEKSINRCVSTNAFKYYENRDHPCKETRHFDKETVTGKTTYVTFGN